MKDTCILNCKCYGSPQQLRALARVPAIAAAVARTKKQGGITSYLGTRVISEGTVNSVSACKPSFTLGWESRVISDPIRAAKATVQ